MKKLYFILVLTLSLVATAQPRIDAGKPEVQVKVVKFYPNPAISYINFEFNREVEKGYMLQVYNFPGKKMVEVAVSSSKTTVSLNDFYRGIYIFQLRDQSGKLVQSGKFQVVK